MKLRKEEQDTLNSACAILERAAKYSAYADNQPLFTGPSSTHEYLKLKLATSEHEQFLVVFLDTRHRLIDSRVMFTGTVDGASVYPREVVKAGLDLNAAAVMFAHNHPSGETEPSKADERITERLKTALALVDIRVLDHFIVTPRSVLSFAETGRL